MINAYELLHREKKAAAIVEVLERFGITAAEMELGSEQEWATAAKAAGVNAPKEKTRALVVEMMREREAKKVEVSCGN